MLDAPIELGMVRIRVSPIYTQRRIKQDHLLCGLATHTHVKQAFLPSLNNLLYAIGLIIRYDTDQP